jgi:hypothetical protein
MRAFWPAHGHRRAGRRSARGAVTRMSGARHSVRQESRLLYGMARKASSDASERAGPLHDGSNHGVDGPSQAQSQPSAEEVRAELERLLGSPDLDLPARGRKFLRYIVEETLAGRADRIKAYSLGTEVFERDPSFDAQSDPVVRIEAGRRRYCPSRHRALAQGRNEAFSER